MLVLAIGLLIARSIYLSSVPSSTLPGDAAAAAFDAMVHFIKVGLRVVLVVGLVVAIGAFFTGPSHTAVQTRSALTSGMDWIRHYGERRGVSTGPVGQWTYLHRRSLRIGAVALVALIFVFWGEPTALLVIVLVILLLVVLGLIELIGRPPATPEVAVPAAGPLGRPSRQDTLRAAEGSPVADGSPMLRAAILLGGQRPDLRPGGAGASPASPCRRPVRTRRLGVRWRPSLAGDAARRQECDRGGEAAKP